MSGMSGVRRQGDAERTDGKTGEDFLIVGIGASAGGIQALKEFFQNVPADSGMAYVVILHLSPDHESQLAEILQTVAPIPVAQVQDESVRVAPNHVYVIPPNKSLAMNHGHLALSPIQSYEERRAPVDIFFRTLAESNDSRAVSVILSGTGADGSMGMTRVKEKGGIVIVQDPREAEYDDMPKNSLAAGLVDYVLPVREIPARIIAYRDNLRSVRIAVAPEDPKRDESDETALREIFTQLRVKTGHDFSKYKRAPVLRRIERRISVRELGSLPAYAEFMREQPDEAQILLKDLLISAAEEAAEESEIGKEELQSVNEELTTVNQEIKIEELPQSNNDFQNLMNSTDIGTIFLDRTFGVKLFTSAAREIFNLIPDDYGRPLSDITHRLADADLLRDAELVLQKLHAVEREVGTEDGRTFLMRISPYRTADDHINGIVLTFLDVTERKRREEETRQLANRVEQQARLFDTTLTSISDFVYIFDRDGRFVYSNQPLLDLLGITLEEIKGKNFFDLNYPPDLAARLQKQIQQVFERAEIVRDETPFTSPEGKPGFYEYIFTPVFAADGTVESVAGSTRDVTERKRIETELRENRERLQQALNAGRIFSWEMNPATRELEWSSNTQNVIGFPPLDNIDKTFELIHPDDIKPTVDAINKAIETGGDYESEYRLVNPANGEAFWFHSQGAITTNTADRQPRFVGITQNITERKETEERLRESEERFRVLISKGADMITVSDREGKIIYASPTTERVSGYPPEEFAQQHPFDLIHPEDRPRCEEALNELVNTPGVSLDLQHRVRHKDGTWRWVEGTFTSLYNDPAVGGLVANVRDVTARKRTEEALRSSEERSRLTMESVTDYAILTTDAEGHIETWNVGAECVFGYTEAEVIGQPTAIIFTPEDRAKGEPEKEMREAREAGRAADERWHVRKDDSRFYVSGVLVPLLDEGGAVIGYAKIARDLTEQRRAEEALRRAHEELESRVRERTGELQEVNETLVEEVRDRLAAEGRARELVRKIVTAQEEERKRVARDLHDQLGQQLTALQLKLETHRTRLAGDEASRAQVEEIQTIARQIDNEVDFLAWELRPASLDDLGLPAALQNFIEEWSKHVGTPAKFHTTGFVSEADRLPPEIEINFYRIAQEALNNIYKHAEAGGVDVIFERRADQVVLIVEDDGKGFNLRTAVGSKDRGIGLINMRERASFVGGTLEIESRKGVGTTLFVRVPLPPVENGR